MSSCAALAQTAAAVPLLDVGRLDLSPGGRGSMRYDAGALLPHGKVTASLLTGYERAPLVFEQEGSRGGVSDRAIMHLVAGVGMLPKLQLGLQVPLTLGQQTYGFGAEALPRGPSFGAPTISARGALAAERVGDPVDGAAQLAVRVPTSSAEALEVVPSFSAGWEMGVLSAEANAGLLLRPITLLGGSSGGGRAPDGAQVDLGAAVVAGLAGLNGEIDIGAHIPLEREPAWFELLLGGRYAANERFTFFLLAGPVVGESPTFTFRLLSGVTFSEPLWRPAPSLPPERAAPRPDTFAATVATIGAGLPKPDPDKDTDGDGVLDRDELCPDVPGLPVLNGCPQTDTDADGVVDPDDLCPKVAGEVESAGCPPADTDGDGLLDRDDACPKEAGPVERKGCPLRDRDGDGIVDEADGCPAEKGPLENKGCPVKDRDGDGVPDELDNCPDGKGPASNQGCPPKIVQLVIITREKLVIKQKVFFETAKSRVLPRSLALLNQVAQVLKEHPELESIIVEGHTDNRGGSELNRKLSQARAESVRQHLVKQGTAPERLKAMGYGPDRPMATNATAAGREENRRVEFVIAAD